MSLEFWSVCKTIRCWNDKIKNKLWPSQRRRTNGRRWQKWHDFKLLFLQIQDFCKLQCFIWKKISTNINLLIILKRFLQILLGWEGKLDHTWVFFHEKNYRKKCHKKWTNSSVKKNTIFLFFFPQKKNYRKKMS